ncbi:hypothetical protein SFRURICE_014797 [Spodoptera frugiperda]|uniref:SFRICE_016746 n=1 Tax=Spodoptera frugiperda TaxID=7108 RepID=A0A2H1VWR5_SPOFR|nr:hypothetical protein SFRURICE_014797 [Spodoptera frugiperda]
MAGFVAFLILTLVAHTFAAPANYGTATASHGSISAGVVEGGTFGDGAFSINARKEEKESNPFCKVLQLFIKSQDC